MAGCPAGKNVGLCWRRWPRLCDGCRGSHQQCNCDGPVAVAPISQPTSPSDHSVRPTFLLQRHQPPPCAGSGPPSGPAPVPLLQIELPTGRAMPRKYDPICGDRGGQDAGGHHADHGSAFGVAGFPAIQPHLAGPSSRSGFVRPALQTCRGRPARRDTPGRGADCTCNARLDERQVLLRPPAVA